MCIRDRLATMHKIRLRCCSLAHRSRKHFKAACPHPLMGAAGQVLMFHACFPYSVTLVQLRFALLTVTRLQQDFHLQASTHAGRTPRICRPPGGWPASLERECAASKKGSWAMRSQSRTVGSLTPRVLAMSALLRTWPQCWPCSASCATPGMQKAGVERHQSGPWNASTKHYMFDSTLRTIDVRHRPS